MGVKFTWHGDEFLRKLKLKETAGLHALGHLMVNQMAAMAHVISGTLKNSMNYVIDDGYQSGFSNVHGEGRPPESAKVSKPPTEKTVRAGSSLVYARPQERHNGWASKSYDLIVKYGLPRLKKAMRF